MPKRLALHLPFLTQEERDALCGSIVIATSNPYGTPTREGVIQGPCPHSFLLVLVLNLFFQFSIRRRDEGYDDCGDCCRRRALRPVLLHAELVSGE